ncbi:MAG: peptide ABC transporter substrate-binding protein [Dehalococcoidia bacterium]
MASRQLARVFRASLFVWYAFALATLVACSGDDEGDPTASPTGVHGAATTAAGAPDADQVLRVNLTSEPSTLDPQRASDQVSLTLVRNLWSGLLMLDEQDNLVADLAAEVPTEENGGISADGLTYTFTLREGLSWSDGEPLVAQAFVDAARRLFRPGSDNPYVDFYRVIAADGPAGDANLAVQAALAAQEPDIAALEQAVVDGLRVSAPDDRTLVVELNRPSPEFLLLATLWPFYPVRQDLIDEHGDRWTEAGNLVSNGPFMLEAWDHGERVRLARNEQWHGPAAALDAVEFDLIDDAAVAFLAYQNDELDVVLLGPAELVQVRGNDALRDEFVGYAQLRTSAVYMNADDPLFADERARQALAGAINREEYAGAVLEGNGLPAYSWIPPGMPGYEEAIGRQFEDAVEASRALLAEAGAEGAEVTLLLPEASSAVLTGEWLQSQWQTNLGITVKLDIRETASYVTAFTAGDFQLSIGGWAADYPDPQNWLPIFTSSAPLNFGRYSSPQFDELIAEAGTEVDFDRRLDLYDQAQRLLIDEVGVMPLSYPLRGALVKPWVQGFVPSPREGTVPGDLYFHRISISGRP